MTVKEFKETLEQYGVPEDAEIFVWAEYGDDGENVKSINISRDKNVECYADMVFEFDGYNEIYDEDVLEQYDKTGKITAVCLYGDM